MLPAVKGLFTSVDPNSRRVVPENADGRVKVKVVYVVLESQYQAALTAAVKSLNAKNSKVCFEIVGYLLEELRDEKNFEAFKEDLATTNIFVGSLIFIEELAEKVCSRNAPVCISLEIRKPYQVPYRDLEGHTGHCFTYTIAPSGYNATRCQRWYYCKNGPLQWLSEDVAQLVQIFRLL